MADQRSTEPDATETEENQATVEHPSSQQTPHNSDDPAPPAEDATETEWQTYHDKLEQYSTDMLATVELDPFVTGEVLWCDFTTMFSITGIKNLRSSSLNAWRTLLLKKGVYVKLGRGIRRSDALIACMTSDKFPPLAGFERPVLESPRQAATPPPPSNGNAPSQNLPSQALRTPHSPLPPSPNTAGILVNSTQPGNGSNITGPPQQNTVPQNPPSQSNGQNSTQHSIQGSMGLPGLSRMFQNRSRFTGALDDDLVGMVNIYKSLATTCKLSQAEMALGVPMMLDGDAMAYFSAHLTGETDFDTIVERLKQEFTSDEQRNRLLFLWQETRLSRHMKNNPEKSELEVFKDVCRLLTTTQRQLDKCYQSDVCLRDQIVVAVDIPEISRTLREKSPKTSQEATQRVANLLRTDPGSAGRHSSGKDDIFYGNYREGTDETYYGLGTRYGGDARKRNRRPGLRGRGKRGTVRRSEVGNALQRGQRPDSNRLGCVVCGRDHFARNHHTQDQIIEGIRRKKERSPRALFAEELALLAEHEEAEEQNVDEDDLDIEEYDEEDSLFHAEAIPINTHLEISLSNHAFYHGRFDSIQNEAYRKMNTALATGDSHEFEGLIMDSGANRRSMMSLRQYQAYCREFGVIANIDASKAKSVRGIGCKVNSIGSAIIPVPFKDLATVFDIEFHIIEGDTPSLLCLRDMKRHELDLRILHNRIDHGGRSQKLSFTNGFLMHKWTSRDLDYALYTETELRKLHRSFGHPNATALANLLKRARPEEFSSEVRGIIDDITSSCDPCQRNSRKPRRFKLAIGTEELRFNHIVAVDVMYIDGKPVIHVVDEATHFMSARFMTKVTARNTWKMIRRCWMDVYLGPPDFLRVDQGSNFVGQDFKQAAAAEGIQVLEAPIESPSTMSHVERYHEPLRTAYKKLQAEIGSKETKEDTLQLAVKAVNDTVGPEGLCPTLLVFGSVPRPARNLPSPQQIERATAMDAAMRAVSKEHARRKVQFGLRYKGPYGRERADLQALPHGAPVLIYRQKDDSWHGPYPFISIEDDTVVVQEPTGRKMFRSTVVKPYKPSPSEDVSPTAMASDSSKTTEHCEERDPRLLNAMFGSVGSNQHYTPDDVHTFEQAMTNEIKGLWKNKVFKKVKRSSVPDNTRIFNTKWVHILKTDENGVQKEKSRLVAQNFRDKGATSIATRSPTVTRLAQRLILASAAMRKQDSVYIRDISQAYTQSASNLERPVYLEAPKEMGLPPDEVLLVLKPLYGIPESGLHWFATYHSHHVERLGMRESKADRCLLYRVTKAEVDGVTILQVDDSLGHGSAQFLEVEEQESKRFQCKPRIILEIGTSASFNGTVMRKTQDGYCMSQDDKLKSLTIPSNEKELVSTRAAVQYIAGCTRPDLCSCVQLLSSAVQHPTKQVYKEMHKIIKRAHDTAEKKLKFISLDIDSLSMVLFTDASFANADNCASQLGFVICLVDSTNRANIIHYGSHRCRRVTRSVMAAELLALSYGFDQAFVAKQMAEEIFNKSLNLDVMIDSQTVFNTVTKQGQTLEKRLQIDAYALRQSHQNGEMNTLSWVPTKQNIADALTKNLPPLDHPLLKLMETNKLEVNLEGWVEQIHSH